MSRAFINEDDVVESPFVPPRADLPKGEINYVTPEGLEALLKEKEDLLARLKELNEGEEHGKLTAIKIKHIELQMLENRILTSNVVEHEDQDKSEVRFGSTVTLQIGRGKNTRKLQIVGVDEADLKIFKISFPSPFFPFIIHNKILSIFFLPFSLGESVFKVLEIE